MIARALIAPVRTFTDHWAQSADRTSHECRATREPEVSIAQTSQGYQHARLNQTSCSRAQFSKSDERVAPCAVGQSRRRPQPKNFPKKVLAPESHSDALWSTSTMTRHLSRLEEQWRTIRTSWACRVSQRKAPSDSMIQTNLKTGLNAMYASSRISLVKAMF